MAAQRPLSPVRRTLLGPFAADTWLALIALVSGLVFGVLTFVAVVVGSALSVGLLPAFLLGVPVLAVALAGCRLLGRVERARLRLMLDAAIPDPHERVTGSWWRRLRARAGAGATWREIAYLLLLLPWAALCWVLVFPLVCAALAALAMPAYAWALPQRGFRWGAVAVRGTPALGAVAVAGLVLVLAAPYLVRALGRANAAMGRALLGPPAAGVLAARVGALQDSRTRVLDAAETERRRIERDLHDGAQQRLVALAMSLGRARTRFESDPEGARTLVEEAHTDAKLALVELRNLARGIHPAVLTDRGLDAALSALASRCPVPVVVEVDRAAGRAARPNPTVESIAYFVVAEALTNVAKHSGASSASVVLRRLGPTLRVVVRDDGVGGADPATGGGLRGLADRVAGVDGQWHLESPPGGPTVLTVDLPCAS